MANGPIDLEGAPTLVLCFDPELAIAAELRGASGVQVVCDGPVEIPGAEAAPRLTWKELRALPKGSLGATRLVVHTLRSARPRGILRGLRQCAPDAHCFLVDSHGSWFESNGRGAVVLAAARGLRRLIGATPVARLAATYLRYEVDPSWPNLEATLGAADEVVAYAEGRPVREVPATPRVVHYIGALGPGGAERQLTLLARGARERGLDVEVWTAYSLEGSEGHYVPDLEAAGVKVRALGLHHRTRTMNPKRGVAVDFVRDHLSSFTLYPLITELQRDPPDVLHCWLDESNTLGAIAGLLTDVPRILVSTRNVSPIHFPRLLRPWFRTSYQALARSPRVTFVANSQAGADDYAAWLELDPARFRRVYNGFEGERFKRSNPAQRATQRKLLGFKDDAFVVVGVFRLAEEKRPQDFVRVVARLRELVPTLRVLHLGVGAQAERTHHEARQLGLEEVLDFRGRVPDPWRYLQVADASILVSDAEGCPNAALESQAMQVPIVATRVGGTPETVVDGETGYLCDMGDVEGIAQRLAQLAGDPELRARMGRAGAELVAARFGVGRMVEESLALYSDKVSAS
ncbi:MAG: glycosyltransferase [Planctomycetes bacterium]|nr:glycosyltransferase [Planctomycetota bacterium]